MELRAQFERERDDAVISAKEDAKRKLALEKAQAETEAKVGYITAETDQTAQAAQSVQTPVDETAEEKTGTTEYVATEEVATEEKPETTEETPGTETVTEETVTEETVTEETVTEETPATEETVTEEPVTAEPAEEKAEETDETAVTETIAEEKAEETDETATEEIVAEETASAENDASVALESLETAINDEDKKLSEEVIAEVEEAEEAATVSEAGAEAEAEATDTAKTEETAATEPAETEESIETTEPAEESAVEEPTTGETVEEPTADEAVEEPTTDEAVEEPTETIAEPTTEEIPEETPEEVTEKVATEPANDEKIIRIPRDIYNDGIPATPIHKKSKYAKPVTKLLVKKPVVKEEPEQNVQTKEEARKSAYLGKWKVEKTEDGKLFAKLRASNGGILLTTPLYTSEIGLKNGITAIKKSLAADNVTVTANKAGKFVFKITAPSGRTIVTSEQYAARFQCEKALDSSKRFAETAVITE